jgi:hypothetical protein
MDDDDMNVRHSPETEAWVAETPAAVCARANRWITSGVLASLVAELGGPSESATVSDLVAWSEMTLDTRGGRERHEVEPLTWTSRWIDALIAAGEPLGMMRTPGPKRPSYDATFILGGTALGNHLRMLLAAELGHEGIGLGTLIVLTADRPLTGNEAAHAARGERTESENALRNLRDEFGPFSSTGPVLSVNGGRDQALMTDDGRAAKVLVAARPANSVRASTADAVRFALERIAAGEREHVLILSSAIYAPFQFFRVAPLLLSAGTRYVELVGTPTDVTADRRPLAQRIAQETHAAIHAAVDMPGTSPTAQACFTNLK